MAYIKVMSKGYPDNYGDSSLINYICNDDKAISGYIGGVGVLNNRPQNMIEEFQIIRNIHHAEGGRHLKHIIVCFEENESVTPQTAYYIGLKVAAILGKKHQIIFAVHEDTDNIHIHMALNTVSYIDGKKYLPFHKEKEFLKNLVENPLSKINGVNDPSSNVVC